MAKRVITAKKEEAKTLGQVFGEGLNVQNTIANTLTRISGANGFALFDKHVSCGNIKFDRLVGYPPGISAYIIAKPDAPALI